MSCTDGWGGLDGEQDRDRGKPESEESVAPTEVLTTYEYGLIHKKVGQLVGKYGFTFSDRKDLFQELVAHLLPALAAYEASKGCRKAFVTAVVERHVATLLRQRLALKRSCARQAPSCPGTKGSDPAPRSSRTATIRSLNHVSSNGRERSESLEQHHLDNRRLSNPRAQRDQDELSLDLKEFLSKLPPDLRSLADELSQADSIRELARQLGEAESTLRGRIKMLRQRFERGHLHEYL